MTRVSGICGKCGKYYSGAWCPNCEKIDVEATLNFITDFHDDYYDHGLGEVVKSRQHRRALMKEKGVEEVGNEWKYIDPKRAAEIRDRGFDRKLEGMKAEAMRILER